MCPPRAWDVAGDGIDGGDLAAFDLGDSALGHAHLLGHVGLGEAESLTTFAEPVAVYAGLVALPGLGHRLLAACLGDDVGANLAPLEEFRHRCSSWA